MSSCFVIYCTIGCRTIRKDHYIPSLQEDGGLYQSNGLYNPYYFVHFLLLSLLVLSCYRSGEALNQSTSPRSVTLKQVHHAVLKEIYTICSHKHGDSALMMWRRNCEVGQCLSLDSSFTHRAVSHGPGYSDDTYVSIKKLCNAWALVCFADLLHHRLVTQN